MGTKKLSFASVLSKYCGAVLLLTLALGLTSPAFCQVVREDRPLLHGKLYPCVYKWSDTSAKPTAIVVAVHGLTLHGLIFETLAMHLAEQGMVVFAPDLRGYGRWCQNNENDQIDQHSSGSVAYDQSRQDLISLLAAAKSDYPGIPLYCIGESLGAGIVLFAAAEKPSLIDGLILSSPAIKPRLNIFPRVFEDTAKLFANPSREVDLVPYIKKFASEDPRIIAEAVNDPLVRKKLTTWDLLKSVKSIKSTLKYAEKVKPGTPILVIQGSNDRMLEGKAIVELLAHLNSEDQTVKWFTNRGHLMLETAYLRPDVLNTVDRWLDDHIYACKDAFKVAKSSALAHFSSTGSNNSQPD